MRAFRVLIAVLSVCAPAQAGPVDELYERSFVPIDETAASLPADGAPESGERLAKLQADLTLSVEGLEGFANEADAEPSLARLRASVDKPARGQFADRATALNAAYRALAATDYTWAKRLPDASCAPEAARARLLRSDALSSWLASLLGAKVDAATALDQASAGNAPSAREYAMMRARARRIGEALSSEKATGSARAALYCRRAQIYESLSAANRASALTSASRKADSEAAAGVYVLARSVQDGLQILGAATAVEGKLVTDERLVRGENLLAFRRGGKPSPVRPVRRGNGLALLEGVSARGYTLADAAPATDDLVHGIGHLERTGAWTETRGLVTAAAPDHFQTDAVVDAGMTGGAALTEDGKLAGVFVLRPVRSGDESFDWPVAVSAPALKAWLAGSELTASAPDELAEAGSSSILTASRSLAASLAPGAGAVEAGTRWTEGGGGYGTIHGSCPTCPDGSGSNSSGGSGYDSSAAGELGKVMGQAMAQMIFKGVPALFRGIGKLFKKKESARREFVDNRRQPPSPPPVPPTYKCSLIKEAGPATAGAEEFSVIVRLDCQDAPVALAGHSVTFTFEWDGKAVTEKAAVVTDASGIASLRLQVKNEKTAVHAVKVISESSHKELDRYDPENDTLDERLARLRNGAETSTQANPVASAAALAGSAFVLKGSGKRLTVKATVRLAAGTVALSPGVTAAVVLVTAKQVFDIGWAIGSLVQGKISEIQQGIKYYDRADEKQSEYESYKKRCEESPPVGLDICAELLWKLQRDKDCLRLRKEWDDKWQGDHQGEIDSRQRAIENLRRKLRINNCISDEE